MTTQTAPNNTKTTATVNALAVASVILAVLALAVLFLVGTASLAVFAVGAGHLALSQVSRQEQAGKAAAYLALAIGYALGLYAIVNVAASLAALAQQASA